jgi:hypothetical protein
MATVRRRSAAPAEPGIEAAVATHFGGDAALYAEFASACAAQFVSDAAAGQAACNGGDLAPLRRLGHDLKSVLVVLGHAGPAELAARLEQHAAAGATPAARAAWLALREALVPLSRA